MQKVFIFKYLFEIEKREYQNAECSVSESLK